MFREEIFTPGWLFTSRRQGKGEGLERELLELVLDVGKHRITEDLGPIDTLRGKFGSRERELMEIARSSRGEAGARALDVLMLLEYGQEGRDFSRVAALGRDAAMAYLGAGLRRRRRHRYVLLMRGARILRLVTQPDAPERSEYVTRIAQKVDRPGALVLLMNVMDVLEYEEPCRVLENAPASSMDPGIFGPLIKETKFRLGCEGDWDSMVDGWADGVGAARSPSLRLAFTRRVERLYHERQTPHSREVLDELRIQTDRDAQELCSRQFDGTVYRLGFDEALQDHLERSGIAPGMFEATLDGIFMDFMELRWGTFPLLLYDLAFYAYLRILERVTFEARRCGTIIRSLVNEMPEEKVIQRLRAGMKHLAPDFRSQFATALELAFQGRVVESLTLLVPLVEQKYRNLLKEKGKSTTVIDGCSGLPVQVGLAALLERSSEWVSLEERLVLTMLLTDLMGPNVRTALAHGLIHSQDGWRAVSRDDPLLWCAWAWVAAPPSCASAFTARASG